MALTFPPQPQTPGTVYEAPNGITYTWDGVKWIAAGTPGAGSANLGNLFIIDQTIAGLNDPEPVIIAGSVQMDGEVVIGNLTSGNVSTETLYVNGYELSIIDGIVHIDNTDPGISNPFDQELNTNNSPLFESITIINDVLINGTTITTDGGTLYVGGTPVGGEGFANTLQNNGYTVTLTDTGDLTIPGTLSSTVAGIPEFNSSTDLNLNAVNRVNIVNSPLNLGSVFPSDIIGKPGDIIYHPDLQQIQAYINGAWENLLRTAENQNVRLPQGGAFQRADGVRAAWFTELPSDISQLTDNNNLLTTQSITLQNIDIDGGGAYSIYETGLMFADGGFGSSRFGPSDTVFDGAGASGGYTNSLNGGGA